MGKYWIRYLQDLPSIVPSLRTTGDLPLEHGGHMLSWCRWVAWYRRSRWQPFRGFRSSLGMCQPLLAWQCDADGPESPGGGGGTDSLSLGTNCETTAPLFLAIDSPCFATAKFTAPCFHGGPRTAPWNQHWMMDFLYQIYNILPYCCLKRV